MDRLKKLNHFYQDIPGMMTGKLDQVYKRMVQEAPQQARFVEVGSFLGRSAAFMAVEIWNSEKEIVLDCVDTFRGSTNVDEERSWAEELTGDYYSKFLSYLSPVIGLVRPFPMTSIEASKLYEPGSLDFVFIDANHSYENVQRDIIVWRYNVKSGGWIGGHDYREDCPGVWRAVNEIFGKDNIQKIGTSWLIQI